MRGKTRIRRLALSVTAALMGSAVFAGGAQAATTHFQNLANILVPGGTQSLTYPSEIQVTGQTGTVSKVTASLQGVDGKADDLDVVLVGPGGQTTQLTSDGNCTPDTVDGQTWVFDDASPVLLPEINCNLTGTFKPTVRDGSVESLPAPAPPIPYGAALSVFNGSNANGTWKLFARNTPVTLDQVNFNSGWALDITTIPPAVVAPIAATKKKCKKGKKLKTVKGKKKCVKKKKKKK